MRHQGQSLAQHVPSVDVAAALGPEGPSEMGRRGGERAAEPWKRGSEDNQDRRGGGEGSKVQTLLSPEPMSHKGLRVGWRA